jgi:hypothetical protein
MPNYCNNILEFGELTEKQTAILNSFIDDDRLDGDKLLPSPSGEYDYNHAVDNWGTKWCPSINHIEDGFIDMDSAWSPPVGLITELSRQLDCVITHKYYESGMAYAGTVVYDSGDVMAEDHYFDFDEEMIDFVEEHFDDEIREILND